MLCEGSPTWTNAFTNRLLIFRHDVPTKGLKSPEIENTVRYINILKGGGVAYENENGPIVSITVGKVTKIPRVTCSIIFSKLLDIAWYW